LSVGTGEHFNFACWWAITEYYSLEDFACHLVCAIILNMALKVLKLSPYSSKLSVVFHS
jgi:hypothetical protein